MARKTNLDAEKLEGKMKLSNHSINFLTLSVLVGWLLAACSAAEPAAPTSDIDALRTQIAADFHAEASRQAVDTMVAQLTQLSLASATPSATALPNTAAPTATPFPSATNPLLIFTPAALPCDQAQLIRDVTIEDNSVITAGKSFIKTWRLKNTGSCTWTTDYDLVYVAGDAMTSSTVIPLNSRVAPGETVDISVKLTAPRGAGAYRGEWMLRNAAGSRFGIGTRGTSAFWVQINVVPLADPSAIYDFGANVCSATWRSGEGGQPCRGSSSSKSGFVILLENAKLENRTEDELTLWTHPNNSKNGWISGTYSAIAVKSGYRFTGWVGCLADSKGCNVTFRLDYINAKGKTQNLASWHEVYDEKVTAINLDLSPLAGQKVQFILSVEVEGGNPDKANAFWFVPAIRQGKPDATTTPKPTKTPTPTATPTETPTPSETPTDTP